MNSRKQIIPLILVVMIIITACGNGYANEKTEVKKIELEEIEPEEAGTSNAESSDIVYEPFSPEMKKEIHKLIEAKASNKGVDAELANVQSLNYQDGLIWEHMLPYWDKINEENFVNNEILLDGLPDDESLCIIVMGYQLNPDGSMRDELIGRITTAKACAEKYKKAYVLVTGGGTASSNKNATEADKMAEWLIDNGIDESRIIIENKSMTSADNALYSYRILRDSYPEVDTAAIVTSEYHVPLGCLLFEYQFEISSETDGDKKISVISNAAYLSGSSSYFGMDGQAYWLRALTDIQ